MQSLIITRLSNRALLQYAKKLANEGYIKQQNNYCYLKIDDEYVFKEQPIIFHITIGIRLQLNSD